MKTFDVNPPDQVTLNVSAQVKNKKVIVQYNGETIRKLSREEAIDVGGKIAWVGKKLSKDKSPSNTAENQETEKSSIDITEVSKLSRNSIYTGIVDRISGGGNALIETPAEVERSHINLGPIEQSSVGEQVRFRYVDSHWGECLTDEYIYKDYSPYDGKSSRSSSTRLDDKPSNSSSGNPFSKNINAGSRDSKNDLLNKKL